MLQATPSRPIRTPYYKCARGVCNVGLRITGDKTARAGGISCRVACNACPKAFTPDGAFLGNSLSCHMIFSIGGWPGDCKPKAQPSAGACECVRRGGSKRTCRAVSLDREPVASSPRSYVPAYSVDQRNGDQSSPFASFLDNASDTGNQSPPSQSPQTSAGTAQSAASANGSGAPSTSANSMSGSTQGSTAPSAGTQQREILHQRAQRLERVGLVRCHVQFRIA